MHALKEVSFNIKKGESIGVIGRNGAGKSTLLKIIAGVSTQTTGKVTVNGRVVPLLELGAGFHPELTARENVFLNGVILGLKEKYIDNILNEIANEEKIDVSEKEVDEFIKTTGSDSSKISDEQRNMLKRVVVRRKALEKTVK